MLRNQVSSVSSLLEDEFMTRSTVAEFAYELRKTPETLFAQFKSAGVPKTAASDLITEADKQRRLEFLKASHGTAADGERKKSRSSKNRQSRSSRLIPPDVCARSRW